MLNGFVEPLQEVRAIFFGEGIRVFRRHFPEVDDRSNISPDLGCRPMLNQIRRQGVEPQLALLLVRTMTLETSLLEDAQNVGGPLGAG